MNYARLFLAALAGTVAYFAFGTLVFGVLPWLRREFAKFPAVYRDQAGIRRTMPIGMPAIFVSIVVLAALFAMIYPSGAPPLNGLEFGALIGIFSVCGFVIHNYVNLNIGARLTVQQSIAYLLEWMLVGVAISLVYRPA